MRVLLLALTLVPVVWPQTRSVPDPGIVTTRQSITPAGIPTVFQARVHGVAFDTDPARLWVAGQARLYALDWKENRVIADIPLGGSSGLQAIAFDRAAGRPVVALIRRGANGNEVDLASANGGKLATLAGGLGAALAGAIAIASGPRIAVVPLTAENRLAVVDLEKSRVIGTVPTGIAPFGAAVSADGAVAFVSNWGGRVPHDGDVTAPTGPRTDADRVIVDERGVASNGTVTRIDLKSLTPSDTIAAGLHPTALVWDEAAHRLYVANGNSDSVSVIDTERRAVVQTFAIEPFAVKAAGIAPTALARSAENQRQRGEVVETRARLAKLTPREFEVLRLVIAGLLNKQVAAELGIKLRTIKTHRARVMQKMGVVSVAELVRLTQKAGVLAAGHGPKGR